LNLSPVKLAKYPFYRFSSTVYKDCCPLKFKWRALLTLEFSGLHYCLFVKVQFDVFLTSFIIVCLICDSSIILSCLANFVNNFFNLFFKLFCCFYFFASSASATCYILSPLFQVVNSNFKLFYFLTYV
jgi:hypothetical protein